MATTTSFVISGVSLLTPFRHYEFTRINIKIQFPSRRPFVQNDDLAQLVGVFVQSRAGGSSARLKSEEAAVRPLGLSPLLERAGSNRMGVPAQPHRENGLGLVAQLLLERAANIAHDRFLVSANSSLRQLRDLARELKGAREDLRSRHDVGARKVPIASR